MVGFSSIAIVQNSYQLLHNDAKLLILTDSVLYKRDYA